MADNYDNDTNDDDDDGEYGSSKPEFSSRLETDEDDVDDQIQQGEDPENYDDDEDIENLNDIDESGRDDDDDIDAAEEINNNEDDDDDMDDEDTPNEDCDINEVSSTDALQRDSPEKVDKRRNDASASAGKSSRKGFRGSRGGRRSSGGSTIISRAPSVRGLTIPFRTIKKSMKLDPDIPIVQNEAAIMATVAVELFLKRLVTQSHRNAKNRGRNTVRYEDVAEARTNDKALAFLETLLP